MDLSIFVACIFPGDFIDSNYKSSTPDDHHNNRYSSRGDDRDNSPNDRGMHGGRGTSRGGRGGGPHNDRGGRGGMSSDRGGRGLSRGTRGRYNYNGNRGRGRGGYAPWRGGRQFTDYNKCKYVISVDKHNQREY